MATRAAATLQGSADRLIDAAIQHLPGLAAAALVLLVAWGLATLVRRIVRRGASILDDPTQRNLIRQASYYAVWGAGAVVALDILGVQPQTFITGLGLGGVALGFALKDIVSNMVSGLLILLTHTFGINDQIVVGETEGTVERIEVRVTHIRTYDGRLVLVPNGEVFSSRVTDNTASPTRRASVSVFLDYDQDLGRALSVIVGSVAGVRGVAATPPPSMRLRDLTPDHLHIEARFWTDSRRTDFMNTASAVRVAIVNALVREGIALPRPQDRHVTLIDLPGSDRGPSVAAH
jgi:small-conductance mechanosensitive channel